MFHKTIQIVLKQSGFNNRVRHESGSSGPDIEKAFSMDFITINEGYGSMSRSSSKASLKAPLLKGRICDPRLRVPSGKIRTEMPSTNFNLASSSDCKAALGEERSINICPTFSLAKPMKGTRRNSFFMIHLKSIGK